MGQTMSVASHPEEAEAEARVSYGEGEGEAEGVPHVGTNRTPEGEQHMAETVGEEIATINIGPNALTIKPGAGYFKNDQRTVNINSINVKKGYQLELSDAPPKMTVGSNEQDLNISNLSGVRAKYYKLTKLPECRLVEGYGKCKHRYMHIPYMIIIMVLLLFCIYSQTNFAK